MINRQDLPSEVRAKKFEMPQGYYRICELQLTNLEPWKFLGRQEFNILYMGIRKRYPQHFLLPFARRQDNDDVACFVVESTHYKMGQVLVIHDYASPGSELDISLPSFWDWYRMAVNEMIEFSNQRGKMKSEPNNPASKTDFELE